MNAGNITTVEGQAIARASMMLNRGQMTRIQYGVLLKSIREGHGVPAGHPAAEPAK